METILNYLIPSAMADTPCPFPFSGGNYGHMGGVGMIIFWILVLIVVVYLIKNFGSCKIDRGEKSPMDILKERYAKGEIDKEEFEAKKKDLSA